MRIQLAWEKSGKAVAGDLDLEIPDLSHLQIPVVAEFKPRSERGSIAKSRTWRGSTDGAWVRIDGKLDNWRIPSETLRPFPSSLEEQVADLGAMVAEGIRADGIAVHGPGRHRLRGQAAFKGEEEIIANGGANALERARWSLSRYAIMDGALWCRHPGPLFKVRSREGGSYLDLASFTKEYSTHTPVYRSVDLDDLVFARPDVDMSIRAFLTVHDAEALRAHDVDGFNMESAFVALRDFAGSGRVRNMSPTAMRAYAGFTRTHAEMPIADIPRVSGVTGWPYDRRAFEFPFRPELVPHMRAVLDKCFERGLHDSYRDGLEIMVASFEARLAADLGNALTEEDHGALMDLRP